MIKLNNFGETDFSCCLVDEWKLDQNELISVASANLNEALIACRSTLVYIQIKDKKLKHVKSVSLEHEIACLDLSPLDSIGANSNLCAVGLWGDLSARLLTLPDLEQKCLEQLKGGSSLNPLVFKNISSNFFT